MNKYHSLFFLFLTIFTHTALAEKQTIRFATEATYPPFAYITADGKLTGFDIEIAEAICAEINANCTFQHIPFDSLIPGLQAGKFDAIHGGLSVTPTRAKQVIFTESYYQNSASFLGKPSEQLIEWVENPTNDNEEKMIIGVQIGTTFPQYLRNTYGKNAVIKTYANIEMGMLDLQAERLQMIMGDTPVLHNWLVKNGNNKYALIGNPQYDAELFGEGYAIAVHKENNELATELNDGLEKIKAKGITENLKEKYLQ